MEDVRLDSGFKCFVYFLGFPIYACVWVLRYWESNEDLYIFRFWLNLKGAILIKWWEKLFWVLGWINLTIVTIYILILIVSCFL